MESEFSKDGAFYSILHNDGKLKIWETATNTLKHEFTPSLHLNQPCTCLKWVQISTNQSPWRKRKRLDSRENVPASHCIALGTRAGSVLIYSPAESKILTTLGGDGGVSAAGITCMTWASHSGLISCAGCHFTRWNIADGAIKTKWKDPKKESITSALVIENKPLLLTSARSITLWNYEKKQVLQTYIGHASDIDTLAYVPININTDGNGYFLSGAKSDRYLSCWNLSENASKTAVAKFVMEDAVSHLSVITSEDGSVYMAATVQSGVVHLFKQTLNGKCAKPLKPKVTIQVVANDSSKGKEIVPIPILTAYLKEDCSTAIIGYGAPHTTVFELVTISSFEKLQCLVRDDPRKLKSTDNTTVSKIKTGNSNNVEYLAPGNSVKTPQGKRKNKDDTSFEVPMEKRLENLVLGKPGDNSIPKSDNVAHLLLQGLHSKDRGILQTVFSTKDESIIRNTVKRLPVQILPVLIKELTGLIQGKTTWSHNGALWLKQVVQIHASQLLANPELNDLIKPTLGLIQNRLTLLPPLCLLRGRLDLLVGQITTTAQTDEDEIEQCALIYQDDSSESSSDEMDNMDNQSESDEQWDENMMSDAEMSN